MASIYDVLAELVTQVTAATAGIVVDGGTLNVLIGTDWPPQNVLQDVARASLNQAVIAVWDRKVGKNTTRWSPDVVATTVTPAGVATAVSGGQVAPAGQATITLSGTPIAGDLVSLIGLNASTFPSATAAAVAGFQAGDTTSTLAARLAAAANASPKLPSWMTIAASGPVITVTSTLAGPLVISSFAGNGGTQTREIGRRDQGVQVACWMRTIEARSALITPLQTLFAVLNIAFATLPDGTSVQVSYGSDFDLDDDTVSDVYRHDFLITVEYPVTTIDQLFAIVAPVPAFELSVQGGP